jgi:hypothetical protein
MNTGSSDNSEKLTSFNNTNTLLKYEKTEYDNKLDTNFNTDGYELNKGDYSKYDASPQNT